MQGWFCETDVCLYTKTRKGAALEGHTSKTRATLCGNEKDTRGRIGHAPKSQAVAACMQVLRQGVCMCLCLSGMIVSQSERWVVWICSGDIQH